MIMRLLYNALTTFGKFVILMGRTFSVPERFRMFWKQYVKEMAQLGINSIGIVLLISFFIGAVICIQMKLNIQSPWMPRWVSGYTTREIMLLEFSSSIMCLILAGKVGSNIGYQLCLLPHPSQDSGYADHYAPTGYLLIGHGYHGSLWYSLYRTHHRTRRPNIGLTARLQGLVRMDVHHQESFLRLHHLCRTFLFRLHRRRWFCECW